jgi:hypothetical protein
VSAATQASRNRPTSEGPARAQRRGAGPWTRSALLQVHVLARIQGPPARACQRCGAATTTASTRGSSSARRRSARAAGRSPVCRSTSRSSAPARAESGSQVQRTRAPPNRVSRLARAVPCPGAHGGHLHDGHRVQVERAVPRRPRGPRRPCPPPRGRRMGSGRSCPGPCRRRRRSRPASPRHPVRKEPAPVGGVAGLRHAGSPGPWPTRHHRPWAVVHVLGCVPRPPMES